MLEGFVFTVYVCQEMLRSFRQIQDSLQINNFRTCIGNSRKTPGKQLQVAEIANYAFRSYITLSSHYMYYFTIHNMLFIDLSFIAINITIYHLLITNSSL